MPDQITMEELIHLVQAQAKMIVRLEAKIVKLEATIDKLEDDLKKYKTHKDSTNSSIPPSKDENRIPRTSSLRQKSDRKVGGQPGHEGKTLEMAEAPDEIIEHRACFCTECGKDLNNQPFEIFGKRQVIDIPTIKQIVTEHQVYRCKCTCGKVVESEFPVGIDSPVSYGRNIESLVGYLNVRQYLPFKRLQELLHDLLGANISEGGLHCLLNRLAAKGADAYELIRKSVVKSSVIGADETGMKVNGMKHWFWTWQNNRATYIAASTNRGTETINKHVADISKEVTLVHDCWKAHFQTQVDRHQTCTSHLERETIYFEKRYKTTWPKRFRSILIQAEKLKKEFIPADYISPNQARDSLEKQLSILLEEPLNPKHKELVTFQKRIVKYRDHILTFLYHPEVPADNNGSERAIRNVKVKQKISGQFKVFEAAENFAILRSIIDTAIKNGQNVFLALNTIADYKRN